MCIQQGRINHLPAAEVRRAAPSQPQRRHQTRSPCPPASCFPPERQRWVREWRLASGIATLRRVHIDCTCHWQLAGAARSGSWQRRARWITAPAEVPDNYITWLCRECLEGKVFLFIVVAPHLCRVTSGFQGRKHVYVRAQGEKSFGSFP